MIDAVEELARRWPAAAPIYHRLVRPLDVAVLGVPSSGRATLCDALHRNSSVTAVVAEPGEPAPAADIVLYLLVGRVRAGDADAVRGLAPRRRIVVLAKADTCGPAEAWTGSAQRCADAVGARVLPVSGLWGAASVTSDDAALLRELAVGSQTIPALAAQFAADDPARTGLLRRIGRQGIVDCVAAVRAGRIAGNPGDVDRLLRRRSGLAELTSAFADLASDVGEFRSRRAAGELAVLAARSPGQFRDALERILLGAAP